MWYVFVDICWNVGLTLGWLWLVTVRIPWLIEYLYFLNWSPSFPPLAGVSLTSRVEYFATKWKLTTDSFWIQIKLHQNTDNSDTDNKTKIFIFASKYFLLTVNVWEENNREEVEVDNCQEEVRERSVSPVSPSRGNSLKTTKVKIRFVHLDVKDLSEELLRQQSYAIKNQRGASKIHPNDRGILCSEAPSRGL